MNPKPLIRLLADCLFNNIGQRLGGTLNRLFRRRLIKDDGLLNYHAVAEVGIAIDKHRYDRRPVFQGNLGDDGRRVSGAVKKIDDNPLFF